MGVISGGQLLNGDYGPYRVEGAPVAGTNEVVSITINGTPTGGTFKLSYLGLRSGAIAYNASAADMQAALRAIPSIGGSNVSVAGTAPYVVTAAADFVKADLSDISLAENNLTGGTNPTVAIAVTTPGVKATARGALTGALLIDTTNGILYINTGTPLSPTWTKVGTQT